jgi:hypothetical protein
MPEQLVIKVAQVVIYTSVGYTTYRASRGIAWTLDKVEHRWKIFRTPALKIGRPE